MYYLRQLIKAAQIGDCFKTNGDIDAEVNSRYQCRDNIRFTCEVTAQSHMSRTHRDHEEIYCIIRGKGRMKIGNEEARFRAEK